MSIKQSNKTNLTTDAISQRELSNEECKLVSGGASFLQGNIVAASKFMKTRTPNSRPMVGGSNDFAVAEHKPGKTLDDMVANSVPLVCG